MATLSPAQFCQNLAKTTRDRNPTGLIKLLDPEQTSVRTDGVANGVLEGAAREHGGPFAEVFAEALAFRRAKEPSRSLEHACNALKRWIVLYLEVEDGSDQWMCPTLVWLCTFVRKTAINLDKDNTSHKYVKKLVEIFREQFQKLIKEKTKRGGLIWISCELLRAYFLLAQVNQCSFLISAIKTSYQKEGGFDPDTNELPKSISVTFYYFWGKHCVFDHNFKEAEEKLSWAFDNCHPDAVDNQRRILSYLVPVKLRYGILPKPDLLKQYELGEFVDMVQAILEGNMRLYSEKLEEHADHFIQQGTYLLMERHKMLVYRNLCKRVFRLQSTGGNNKLSLQPFEQALKWQDDCDDDEAACILSNLIYQGAIKGYMSHEHHKIVFSKDNPFPTVSSWK